MIFFGCRREGGCWKDTTIALIVGPRRGDVTELKTVKLPIVYELCLVIREMYVVFSDVYSPIMSQHALRVSEALDSTRTRM